MKLKTINAAFIVTVVLFCYSITKASAQSSKYTKQDLKHLSWIEGNWKGMDGNTPFYEIYKLVNDSTLEVTSYSWNGKDSSQSSKTLLQWKNNNYYLGDNMNWRVTEIIETAIRMIPNNKASNDILWKKKDANSWDAVLKSARGEKLYHMERIYHFGQ